ncbi:MAG: VOC family protein [Ferruginibacter sp.]
MSSQKITPFLWFNNNAEEAMDFYVSIFKNAKVINKMYQGEGGPLLTATFQLEGQELMVLNGGPMFSFTEAISLFVKCETQEEVDFFWNKFIADGGQESRCGWLKDRYGLSWQIIPNALGKLMGDKDRQRAGRVMQAMMKMNKIVIADLQKAYDNV